MQTEVTRLLGIEYPIIQGGMAWVAQYHLAAGVSEAGGLGLIGAASAPTDWVRDQVRKAKELTDKPFGVNIMLMSPYADSLIPTKDGCNLVCVLPEQITSPKMTAEWENTLMEIERGKADADAFLSGIVRMTGDLVKAYPFLSDAEAQRFGTGKEEIGKCPRCGSPVYVGKGNFYCSSKECSFCLWEDNKFFSSKKKKLTKKIAKELLDKGWCRVTGLYTPKKPQLYDAVIRLDDSGGKYVSFKMEFDR